jgi:hypothetical protein
VSDESLFREVDEEVRQEQFKKLWERYGNYVLALCVIVVAGVAGFKGWQYWQVRQAEAAGEAYFAAAKQAAGDKAEDAARQFAAIDHSGYGQLARLREAGVLAEQGKTDEAVKLLDALAADGSADPTLRDLAKIRAGYLLADTLKPDELQVRLGAFDKDGNPWRLAAREIFGLAAWRTGDHEMADRYMNAIVADPEASPSMRQRAQTMIQLLTPLLAKKVAG